MVVLTTFVAWCLICPHFKMKAKFGAIVVDGRGKVGGHVASKNRSGAYFRTKVTPSNPQSTAQAAIRSLMASLSAAWRALTQAQRNAWNGAVANFQRTNVFGDNVQLTGKNLFQYLNMNRLGIGQTQLNTPPLPVEVTEPVITAVDFEDATVAPLVELTLTGDPADQYLQISATAPTSPGVGFFKGKHRVIATIVGDGGGTYDVTAEYVAKFGAPVAGQKASFKVVPIVTTTGQSGVGATAEAIAIASS